MNHGSVLIVEDDSALRHSIARTLCAIGFEAREASTGESALAELRSRPAEVILLDLNMPGMGGMDAAARIRSSYPHLAIMILTVRDSEEDKISALDAGADDYVTKPFRLPELAARVRAAVRRVRPPEGDGANRIAVGEIELDAVAYRVTKAKQEIHLTPKEFDLLRLLMKHAGSPITHQRLLSSVWGPEYGNEREYLRTYISQLRKKLEVDPSSPKYLLTENYVGYRFQYPSPAADPAL